MKKRLTPRNVPFIFLLMIAATSSMSFAKEKVGNQDVNIGVIDMQRVIVTVDEGKKAKEDLEKEIKKKEEALSKQKQELEKLNKDWQAQFPLLSEDAKLKKQKEIQEKLLALRNAEMSFKNEISQKEQQVTQGIAVRAAGIVKEIAKAKQLKVVFESHSAGLVYVDEPTDLTQEVITLYGKKKKSISRK